MFRGLNIINIDMKGRLAVPSRYRSLLEEEADCQLIVTIDPEDSCLLLYPLPIWEIIEQKLEALPSFNYAARRIQRLLIGHATEVELDGQHRFLIPQLLREYAVLDKRAMLVGQGKKFEIWSEECWQQQREMWLEEEANKAENIPPELASLSL